MIKFIRIVFFASIFFMFFNKVYADDFLCTKYSNVNLRNGPGIKFTIIVKLLKKGYPLKIIDKIEEWYAVEDFKGDKMWVSSSNLSSKCGAIVKTESDLKIKPNAEALSIAIIEEGFIINKITCYKNWCETTIENKTGWILKSSIWGVK